MQRHALALAAALALLGQAAVAQTYTQSSDNTGTEFSGPNFGFGSSTGEGFGWDLPTSIFARDGQDVFSLPSFTITAGPSYVLGNWSLFLGNLSFVDSATSNVGASITGNVAFDGGTSQAFSFELTKTASGLLLPFGTLAGSLTIPSSFSSLVFSSGSLALSAGDGGLIFTTDSQGLKNKFETSFTVTAVPEPASLALMLAGLGVVAASAQRRRKALASD